ATTTIASGCNARMSSIDWRSFIRVGCKIDIFISSAARLIGGASIFCERPTGLSGCVTTATISCSDSRNARNVGTPISPVPMKTMRISRLTNLRSKRNGATPFWLHRLRHHLFAGGDFTRADGRAAFGAEIIEDFLLRQNQEQPLADRVGGFALLAVESRGGEIFKLLHVVRSRR